MTERKKFSTNTPSERRVGYSRALAIGDERMYFSGTTSVDEEGTTHGETVYDQTNYIFSKIKEVIDKAGFSMSDIVLVRAYLVDMQQIEGFDQAFQEHFAEINPCCTLVGSPELVAPELLVEIECFLDKG